MITKQKLFGKLLNYVEISADRETVTFHFLCGATCSFKVYGDCCSSSWIEHFELPGDIRGAYVMDVIDGGGVEVAHPDHECLQVYNTTFRTTLGDIVLEYRNSSNGYYGGALEDV